MFISELWLLNPPFISSYSEKVQFWKRLAGIIQEQLNMKNMRQFLLDSKCLRALEAKCQLVDFPC